MVVKGNYAGSYMGLAQDVLDAKNKPQTSQKIWLGTIFHATPAKGFAGSDLIIRTSGELCLSTFAKAAYSELYLRIPGFDFDEAALQEVTLLLTIAIAVLEELREDMDQAIYKENIVCGIGPGDFPSSLVLWRAPLKI